jgi:serine/threonine-protein kinase
MDTVKKSTDIRPYVNQPVVMPDGTQPIPLGSGTIKCLLGAGGAANVYKIWNTQLESYRAVKVLKPDLAKEWRKRFQTEMKIMAALSHPNIIEIHSVGVWNTLDFIEMELIDGAALDALIAGKGALPAQVCTAISVMIARALVHAHDQKYVLFGKLYHGIIHRDIKPSNIMIAKDGRAKLMDFGVARPITTSLLTTTDGGVVGTIQYMAPEQLNGGTIDVTADVYALGTILYEMLTGEKAFPHVNLSDLFEAKTKNEFVPLHLFNVTIPKQLKKLVNSCMSYDPAGRPQAASVLLDELERIHYSFSHESCETALKNFMNSADKDRTILFARRRRFIPFAKWGPAAAIAVAAIAVIAVALKTHTSAPEPQPVPIEAPQISSAPAARPQPIVIRVPRVSSAPAAPAAFTGAKQKPAGAFGPNRKTDKRLSYLDEAKARLGMSDPLDVLAKETEDGKYESTLMIFNDLPSAAAQDPVARLFRLRALYALGKKQQVAEILGNQAEISDGEYYLIKAKISCEQGKIDQSLSLVDKALSVKARNLDAQALHRDCIFCRAQCLTRRFDNSPTDANRKDALDSWFEVKNTVRKYPGHEYNTKAVAEMQRIGENPSHD